VKRDDPAYRGQADYSRPLLRLYDPLVLGPIARHVWRCPTERLVEGYRTHIRAPHLDIGPGTGYFIERSGLPDGSDVTILDPNPNVLRHAAQHLRRLHVTSVEADVLKPLPVPGPFASAALNLVIHCLPGPQERKATAVANVAAVLAPDGILFGSTVLGESGPHRGIARRVLRAFNWRGAFDNLDDSVDSLRSLLEASFDDVKIQTIGSVATFVAKQPRREPPTA
jgi:SAM-dependent methyltransferase